MNQFEPILSLSAQNLLFMVSSVMAVLCVVAFFLYESKKNRKFMVEIGLALAAALPLGFALFFFLVRSDVIL